MNADAFVKIIRKGDDKLRVDEIILTVGDQQIHGKGMLRISRKRLRLDVTLARDQVAPAFRTGVFTSKDFWKLEGLIEDQLRFTCPHVSPHPAERVSNGIRTLTFKLHPVDLVPSEWDAMSNEERHRYFDERRKAADAAAPVVATETVAQSTEFHALLRDYPLISPDSGTKTTWTNPFLGESQKSTSNTFVGEIEGFEFALIREEKNTDLHVHLRSKKDYRSANEESDWNKYHAFMHSLAFTHGMHAWPYRVEYWRDGRKLRDRITSANRLRSTTHAPFTERLHFNAKAGKLQWNLQDALSRATHFLEQDSVLSKEVSQILFLFREAGAGVHAEISTLALCTLFENLVRLLFRELGVEEKLLRENKDILLFQEAKGEIAEQIGRLVVEKGEGYNRFHKIVSTATPFTQREMFQGLVNHFGLQWQDDMEKLFKTWKKARNPLVHFKDRADRSEDEVKNSMLDESRIAGAINILLLKSFGYAGWMRSSAFEDKYRQI